jgi:hypothetical protein
MASGGPYARAVESICASRDCASKASRAIGRRPGVRRASFVVIAQSSGRPARVRAVKPRSIAAELTQRFHERNVALRPN